MRTGRPRAKLYGIAINDADYPVNYTDSNGKRKRCPLFSVWKDMINRCCNSEYQAKHKSYIGATVCDDWLSYMNFYQWAIKQDYQGKRLDKDIIKFGNKLYSPETCAFVTQKANTFVIGEAPNLANGHGTSWHTQHKRFIAQARNPFTGIREHLGYYQNESYAHLAWKKRKHELACELADLQSDNRVANALRVRYL